MKPLFSLLLLLLVFRSVSAEPVSGFEFTRENIRFTAGTCHFTLNYLQLFSGQEYFFPEEIHPGNDKADLIYPNGITATVTARNSVLTYTLNHAGRVHACKLFATLPVSLVRDGGFRFEETEFRPFPDLARSPKTLYRGKGRKLTLRTATGSTLGIQFDSTAIRESLSALLPGWRSFTYWGYRALQPADRQILRLLLPVTQPENAAILVDRFGQPVGTEFPGKIHKEEELKADAARDAVYYGAFQPPPRTATGGLPGSGKKYGIAPTGFFRLVKAGGRDFLATPEGDLFFQVGVCAVGPCDDYTYVEGRREIYEWLPETTGEFATAYMGKKKENFSFYLANVIRKTGRPFSSDRWKGEQVDRLRALGFNSMGAFVEPSASMRSKNFPYTPMLPVAEVPVLLPGIFDPFEPESARKLNEAFAAKVAPRASDPLIIGWFIANEQRYSDLLRRLPQFGADKAAKRKLADFLRERYPDIAAFRRAWALPIADLRHLDAASLTVKTEAARNDMAHFAERYLDAYFRLIAETFRRHDPNHLLIGARFLPPVSRELPCSVVAAGKYCDVFSVNDYTRRLDSAYLESLHRLSGRPLLLSEWSYGTSEQGLAGGCVDVSSQTERGLAYRSYLEQAAALPYVIGSQYFAYLDQALTGRWFQKYNGESMNVGLLNVADRPFPDFNREIVKSNYAIYEIALGMVPPFQSAPLPPHKTRPAKTMQIPRALPGMKVDCEYHAWPNRPSTRLGAADLTAGTPADGFSADVNLAWDERNLYFFAVVKEPSPGINHAEKSSLWYGDAIEFFIGTEKPLSNGPLLFSDRQVIIGATPETRHWWFNAPEQFPIQVEYQRHPDRSGWTMEGAIPWEALRYTPKRGDRIRFDFGFDDARAPRKRQRQFMWSGTEQNSADRTGWGTAILVD